MKKWFKIEEFAIFKKVAYYTIRNENDQLSETDKFLEKFSAIEAYKEKLNKLIAFIEGMGDEYGAKQEFFRHEAAADALPPPSGSAKRYGFLEFIEYDLRLYCCRLSDSVVVLYGGGQKTTAKAQDCPNVAPHFRLARRATEAINEKIREKSLNILNRELQFDETEIEL